MTNQIIDNQRACFVSISKLSVHPDNVRRTDKRADLEPLASSIAAHGLLQNLSVVRGEDGRYAVVAGGRRLAALRLLAKHGRIPRDFAAPCTIVDAAIGAEASLAENVQRVAMNPMDEMEAFAALADAGMSVEEVSTRFGSTVRHVEQRLALGRLSPKLRNAYRKAEITLDVARAFCLTDDHAAQERLFKQFGKPITHAASVRAALAGGRIPATDKLARFVGLEAYKEAGGRVTRDLFESNVAFLEDGDILRRLAAERTETIRQELVAEGWGWAEVQLSQGQIEGCASERIRPSNSPSDDVRAQITTLEEAIETLDAQLEKAEDDDALWEARDGAEAKLDGLRESAQSYDPELMAYAGAVIAIGHDGAPVITRGLIKRADLKTVRKLQQAASPPGGDLSDPNGEADKVAVTQGQRLPKALIEDLTKARTRGLRAELAQNPHIALALLVHVLQLRSARSTGVPGVEIASRPVGFDDDDAFEQCRTAWPEEEDESRSEDKFAALIALPAETLLKALALYVAETLNFSHQGASLQDGKLQQMSDTLASALDLDMGAYWEASNEFWKRAPKAFILDAVASAPSLSELSDASRKMRLAAFAKLKKAELAATATRLLQASGWLPEVLITPNIRQRACCHRAGRSRHQ